MKRNNQLINLFVEEIENGEIVFATWCKGQIIEGFFYGKKSSCSNLMADDEAIEVKFSDCEESDGDLFIASTNPQNDDRIIFMKESDCPCIF